MQSDVTYLAIILALFALMFALVKVCDLIIGSDQDALTEHEGGSPQPVGADSAIGDQAVAA